VNEYGSCCASKELTQDDTCLDVSIFSQGPAVVFRWRNEEHWPVEFVSPNAVLVFGFSDVEFLDGRVQYDALIHPEDLERVATEVARFSESGAEQFQHKDYRIITKDGTLRWVEDHTQILRDENGNITHYLGYVLDVSARKQAEETLRDSEANVRAMLNAVPDLMFTVNRKGVYLDYSARNPSDLTTPPEDFLGKGMGEIFPADIASVGMGHLHRAIASGEVSTHEYALKMPDGADRSFEARYSAKSDSEVLVMVRDVTLRKDAEEQLIQAKLTAETASQAKSEFLSRMSHELRTPMTAILGYTELVLDVYDDSLSDEQRESLGVVYNAGRHLLDLINEALDLSKIEAGKLKLSCVNVDWREVVKQCVELTVPSLEKQSLTLVCEISADEPMMVKADRMRLRQVLLNLLSNAVKFNRPNGSVILRSKLGSMGQLCIEVIDSGEGLSEDQLGELFQPFHRLVRDADATEGMGIGLVISKRLVELMGGTIGVKSVPGKGSTFWVELPAASD